MDLRVALLFPVWKPATGNQAPCQFPSAAMTKHHWVGGLNLKAYCLKTRRVESETKVLKGLVTSGDSERESIPCFSPSFWWLLGDLWCCVAYRCITWALLPRSRGVLLMCMCVQIPPFFNSIGHAGVGTHLLQYDLILTTFTMTLFPNKAMFWDIGVRASMHEFLEETLQPITNF